MIIRIVIFMFSISGAFAGFTCNATLDIAGEPCSLNFNFAGKGIVVNAAAANTEIEGDQELTRSFAIETAPWLFDLEEIRANGTPDFIANNTITEERMKSIRGDLEKMPNRNIAAMSVVLYSFQWESGGKVFKAIVFVPWSDKVQVSESASIQMIKLILFEKVGDRWQVAPYSAAPFSGGLAFANIDKLAMFLAAGGVWQPQFSKIAVFFDPLSSADLYKKQILQGLNGH